MDFHYITGLFHNSNVNYNDFPQNIEEFSFICDQELSDESCLRNVFWRDFGKNFSSIHSSIENKHEKIVQNNKNSLSLKYKYSDPVHQLSNKCDTWMSYLITEVRMIMNKK